jgi:hypothetical protein
MKTKGASRESYSAIATSGVGVICEVPKGPRHEHSMYYVFVHRTDGWWRTSDQPFRTIAGIAAEAGCFRDSTSGRVGHALNEPAFVQRARLRDQPRRAAGCNHLGPIRPHQESWAAILEMQPGARETGCRWRSAWSSNLRTDT